MKEDITRETLVIKDLDTLKVIADPLRNQILETLALRPLTVKKVAEKLGLSPKKLYYHIGLLEERGLVQVVETRVVSNIIEKVYRTTAPSMIVDPALCVFATGENREGFNTVNAAIFDTTREDLLRSLEARTIQIEDGAKKHPRQVIVYREVRCLDETRAQEFQTRLSGLLQEFEAADEGTAPAKEEAQTYALTVAFYPRFYYPGSDEVDAPPDQP